MKVFEIQVDKRFDVYFRLAVTPTRKAMHAAIKKDDEKIPDCIGSLPKDTMGMFRSMPGHIAQDIPGVCRSNIFGVMYLNLEDMCDEVIVHECGHAAFFWEHDARRYVGKFDEDDFEEQETFCYFLGKAVTDVKKLSRRISG